MTKDRSFGTDYHWSNPNNPWSYKDGRDKKYFLIQAQQRVTSKELSIAKRLCCYIEYSSRTHLNQQEV
jgi:hypothetical protein